MFCHWLRLFTLIGLLWSSISIRTYQGYKAMPKDVAHRIPHTRELSAGSLLVGIAGIFDAVWILLALVLLQAGSKKDQFATRINKEVAVIWLLDLIFCAMLAGGVYLQSKFIPWHLSVCKHPQTWLQSPDGLNFFVEISYWLPDDRRHSIPDRSAEGLCRNMVLAQGAAIAVMAFHIISICLEAIERVCVGTRTDNVFLQRTGKNEPETMNKNETTPDNQEKSGV